MMTSRAGFRLQSPSVNLAERSPEDTSTTRLTRLSRFCFIVLLVSQFGSTIPASAREPVSPLNGELKQEVDNVDFRHFEEMGRYFGEHT
jgi:hypothetical protein